MSVDQLGFAEIGVTAERAPGAFDSRRKRQAADGGDGSFEDWPDVFETTDGFRIEEFAAIPK